QPGQRMGQSRYRRFWQAGFRRQILVAQHSVPRGEAPQDFHAPRQGGDKMAVLRRVIEGAHRIEHLGVEALGIALPVDRIACRRVVTGTHGISSFHYISTKQNTILQSETCGSWAAGMKGGFKRRGFTHISHLTMMTAYCRTLYCIAEHDSMVGWPFAVSGLRCTCHGESHAV